MVPCGNPLVNALCDPLTSHLLMGLYLTLPVTPLVTRY